MYDIERFSGHNQPGGCYLMLVPVSGVESVPQERYGVVETAITLTGDGFWVRIDPTRFTQDFSEKWDMDKGARVARATLECMVPKDRVALLHDLYALGAGRYVVLHHDLNGTTKLIGTKREPAMVRVQLVEHGRGGRANEPNQYRMRIEVARSAMCPFYLQPAPPTQVPGACMPCTVSINFYTVASVISGGAVNIPVVNSLGLPTGSWNAALGQWEVNTTCAPVTVQLVDSESTPIGSPVLLPSGSSQNIAAPDGTVKTTDGSTTVVTVPSGNEEPLPQSAVPYKDAADADQVTPASDTAFASGTLRPSTQVPRRALTVNSVAMPHYATLDRLLDNAIPNIPVVDETDAPVGAADGPKWVVPSSAPFDPYYAIAIGHP